jgi:NTE family protein
MKIGVLKAPVAGRPKIGLVLSGGGGKGLAQIGVLRALERNHIPIDLIVGTSLGSVVGGLYASGYSTTEIESIAIHTRWGDLLSFSEDTKRTDLFVQQKEAQQQGFLLIRFEGLEPIIPSSISGGQRLSDFFSYLALQALYHPNPGFDGLKIPYRAVATDLLSGKRIILDHGSLAEAMRASTTVPLLYSPIERDSMFLVDGGLTSNIPTDVARSLGCNVVITVNSTSSMRTSGQLEAPWEIADQIMTIMMQESNAARLKLADVVITPGGRDRIVSDFNGIDTLIAAGDSAGEEAIPRIRESIDRASGGSRTAASAIAATPESEERITSVRFEGNHFLSDSMFQRKLKEHFGGSFSRSRLPEVQECLIRCYREKGYSLARVEELKPGDTPGSIVVTVNEGRIAQIRYEGNTKTRDYVIRREIPFNEGDIFNIDAAQRSIVNIKSTGLFDYVLMDVRYNQQQEPVLVLKVKETSSELVRLGLHADDEHGVVSTVDIRDANFRGAWEDFGLALRYGYRDRGATLGYTVYRIFNTYLTSNLQLYARSRDVIAYSDALTQDSDSWDRIEAGRYRESHFGGVMTFGMHLERRGDANAQFRYEHQRIASISGEGYSPEDHTISSLKVQGIIDNLDKFSFPTTGTRMSISYESALKQLGGDVSFGKFNLLYETYLTPIAGQTLRPRLTFGFADKTLPTAEQFSLGGYGSFFGLREDDSRGRQLFLINFEYRYSLPFKIVFDTYLKLRYDLGTISLVPEELKLATFRHALGVEIALDTPVGQASVAGGKSFYYRNDLPGSPATGGPFLFYFSLGQTF